jgi:excisionase family DNA binding protein
MENQYDPDRLLDVDEAAALLGVKPGTLYSWVSKGNIPYRKVGSLVRFHRGELMAWTMGKAQDGSRPGRKKLQGSKLRVVS